MDPKCSTNQSVIVLDPFHHSVYVLPFVCFFILLLRVFTQSIYLRTRYLFVLVLYFLSIILSLFQSIGVASVCMLCLSQPSTLRLMAWHCTTCYLCLRRCCLCRSFVTTDLDSLGRRISADTGCAGCRRVERTFYCEAHTYTAAPLQKTPRALPGSQFLQQHLPLKKTPRVPVSSFFREVYIEAPFRKNINGKNAFSVSVPAPL